MSEEVLLSRETYEKIKEEYELHTTITRKEVAARIKEAREFGDLSENAEYDAAKNEQAELEEKIHQLENKIRNAKIIDDVISADGVVSVGSQVTLKEKGKKDSVMYEIVGITEADPFNGKISNESPIGVALLGKKKGETVEIEIPDGKITYKIINIGRK